MITPAVNAITTDTKIPEMIARAFPELIYSPIGNALGSVYILMREKATAAPNNSKTIDTVVDVGIPKVLNTSKRITSVTITAKNKRMISEK